MADFTFSIGHPAGNRTELPPVPFSDIQEKRNWFAAFTAPHAERAVVRQLDAFQIESFLPTYQTTHVWKNRQKKEIVQALFPSYVFVYLSELERRFVFHVPAIVRLVGGSHGPISIPAPEIDTLRSAARTVRLEPYAELLLGESVRVKHGPLQGIKGILVRKKGAFRLVLSVSLLNQHAAVEISAEDVETVSD